MFENYFSLRGRITRTEFWLTAGPVQWVVIPFVFFVGYHNSGLVWSLLAVPCWVSVAACVKRSHDLGYSGWFALLPLFNPFILAFREGQPFVSRFGPNPKVGTLSGKTAIPGVEGNDSITRVVDTIESDPASPAIPHKQLQEAL